MKTKITVSSSTGSQSGFRGFFNFVLAVEYFEEFQKMSHSHKEYRSQTCISPISQSVAYRKTVTSSTV
jgi:hypothetical protein